MNQVYLKFLSCDLPAAWKSLLLTKNYNSVLRFEQEAYHIIAKNPDSLESYARFFLNIEPLTLCAAQMFRGDILQRDYIGPTNIESASLIVHERKFEYIVVLKGTLDLAHGNLLLSMLTRLTEQDKDRMCIILLDYEKGICLKLASEYKIVNIGLGAYSNDLSEKYYLLQRIISNLSAPKCKVTFWGVPFGVTFAGYLIKSFNANIKTRYVTLKHLHSLSPLSVDVFAAQYHVVKSLDYVNRTLTVLDRLPFTENQLCYIPPSSKTDVHAKQVAKTFLNNKESPVVISSLCRIEKCLNSDHMQLMSRIQELHAYQFVFGRDRSKFNRLCSALGRSHKLLYLGWMKTTNSIIDMVDVYIDPVPHGGGFSLALAMYNAIPTVIPPRDLNKSPSGVHEVNKVAQRYSEDSIEVGSEKIPCKNILFPSTIDDTIEIIKYMISSAEFRHQYGFWCKKICNDAFLYTSYANTKRCFGIS